MLLLILVISEFLTFSIIKRHFRSFSRTRYYISMLLNTSMSIFLWITYSRVESFTGFFDDPYYIWLNMNLNGIFCAILAPRILLIILHYTGVLINLREGKYMRWLTDTGLVLWIVILLVIVAGSLYGRYNTKTEEVTIYKEGLHPDLEGLTIVQISDLHLAGFFGHEEFLKKQMEIINNYSPDIIVNSGDFVSYGWREYGRMDTILSLASGKIGNFAVFGNHDMGTYHPELDFAGRESNISMMRSLIINSGYHLLADDNFRIRKGNASVSISGIITKGRHGHIRYGNLARATAGTRDADFKILISHDPNHWMKKVAGKSDVDLTLAGHTHGMQMGIYTRKFRWSPAGYFYPYWNGLYKMGSQYLYVNRGLGVLAIPFRIWMPPEITLITITGRH